MMPSFRKDYTTAVKNAIRRTDTESKKSLEIYQHLSLDAVEDAYQEAVQAIGL